jgi:hypothetical protein
MRHANHGHAVLGKQLANLLDPRALSPEK